MEYKDTIFLPKTTFEMRANLAVKEPKILEEWNKEEIFKSIMECLCFDSKNSIEFIMKNTKQKINMILCSGGASRNKLWAQIRSDILNNELIINNNAENVSLGTAIMGALAAKIYKNEIDVFKHIKLKNSHIKNTNIIKDLQKEREYFLSETYISKFMEDIMVVAVPEPEIINIK